jgi:2-polyprenyl-6-hydroxyphenyl methylase/3-demethylubiquinone-9 3-methyltransferase
MQQTGGTVDAGEVGKFAALAETWWNPDGPFRPLHRMNPIRLDWLRDHLCAQFGRDPNACRALQGLRLLDVGCGGGLLSEPLARMGASVTGIDAAEEGVMAARTHAEAMGLEIDYRAMTAEELVATGERFDGVLALEIVEHVSDLPAFASALGALVEPEGLVALSTLNRTARSYAMAIVGAEYLLGWLPKGTHDWNRFPTPDEMRDVLAEGGLSVVDEAGFGYDPLRDVWRRGDDLSINYGLVAVPT